MTAVVFDKEICNKVIVFEEGIAEEQIKIKLEGQILPGATMEMVRTNLHQKLDEIFNGMWQHEASTAASRAQEAEHWVQHNMFVHRCKVERHIHSGV